MKMENNRITLFLAILLTLLLSSCIHKDNFSFNEQLPDTGWSRFYKAVFSAEIADSTMAYDISVSLRNSYEYPFRNIFLFISTTSPSGQSLRDTVEFQLADERGVWYGKGLGDLHNITLPYRTNVLFPSTGEYKFTIEQGMRKDNLKGIVDVGIIIKSRE